MILHDERNEQEKQTHFYGIVATDNHLSGWGHCPGKSVAIWAVSNHEHALKLLEWVKSRPEMKRVVMVNLKKYKIRPCYHCHIYKTDYHPCFEG